MQQHLHILRTYKIATFKLVLNVGWALMTYFRSNNSYFQDYKSEMLSLDNILQGHTESNNFKQRSKEHISKTQIIRHQTLQNI